MAQLSEMYEESKSLLIQLQQLNISFEDLSAEPQFSEVEREFLRQLYDQLPKTHVLGSAAKTRTAQSFEAVEKIKSKSETLATSALPAMSQSAFKSQQRPTGPHNPTVKAQRPPLNSAHLSTSSIPQTVGPSSTSRPVINGTSKTGRPAQDPSQRAAYLAKLMAARGKKPAQPPTPTSQAADELNVSEETVELKRARVKTPPPQPAPKVDEATFAAAKKKKAQTELALKRMEELKAKAKASLRESTSAEAALRSEPGASVQTSAYAQNHQVAKSYADQSGLPTQRLPSPKSQAISNGLTTSKPAYGAPAFGGIPGLFMASSPQQPAQLPPSRLLHQFPLIGGSSSEQAPSVGFQQGLNLRSGSHTPAKSVRKRPVASDFDSLDSERPTPVAKRPFGQTRLQSYEDSVIISVSDDEEEEGEEDCKIEPAEVEMVDAELHTPTAKQITARSAGALPGLPQQTTPSQSGQPRSALNTPSGQTISVPITGLERKIAALKKQIEEKQRGKLRDKLDDANLPQTPGSPLPALQTQSVSEPSLQLANSRDDPANPVQQSLNGGTRSEGPLAPQPVAVAPAAAPDIVTANALPRSSDRRAEIRSRLEQKKIEDAAREARLHALRSQMEELEREQSQRQAEEQRLTEELEALGVDTDGMDLEEMQEKMDAVEQQMADGSADALSEGAAHTYGTLPAPDANETDLDSVPHTAIQRSLSPLTPSIESSSESGDVTKESKNGVAEENAARDTPGLRPDNDAVQITADPDVQATEYAAEKQSDADLDPMEEDRGGVAITAGEDALQTLEPMDVSMEENAVAQPTTISQTLEPLDPLEQRSENTGTDDADYDAAETTDEDRNSVDDEMDMSDDGSVEGDIIRPTQTNQREHTAPYAAGPIPGLGNGFAAFTPPDALASENATNTSRVPSGLDNFQQAIDEDSSDFYASDNAAHEVTSGHAVEDQPELQHTSTSTVTPRMTSQEEGEIDDDSDQDAYEPPGAGESRPEVQFNESIDATNNKHEPSAIIGPQSEQSVAAPATLEGIVERTDSTMSIEGMADTDSEPMAESSADEHEDETESEDEDEYEPSDVVPSAPVYAEDAPLSQPSDSPQAKVIQTDYATADVEPSMARTDVVEPADDLASVLQPADDGPNSVDHVGTLTGSR